MSIHSASHISGSTDSFWHAVFGKGNLIMFFSSVSWLAWFDLCNFFNLACIGIHKHGHKSYYGVCGEPL